MTYVYDNNGNLLNDGVNTYTYDSANRLTAVSNQQSASSYQYSGLGDRLRQTVNGVTTTFTMDLNAGLTQALSDGTNHYIYGLGRIAQVNTTTEYFLGDALGSVRQLTNQSGEITYSRAYDPYGVVSSTTGSSQSAFGYTGESYGDSTQLLYLRARHYASGMGRFLTRDTWSGNAEMPMSFNRWNYVDGNPVNRIDPTGLCWIVSGGKSVWIPDGATPCLNGGTTVSPPSSPSTLPNYFADCDVIIPSTPPTGGLEQNDIKILAVIVALESSNGKVPDYVSYMKAFTLLNLRSFHQATNNFWKPLEDWKHHERILFDAQVPPINDSYGNQYNRLMDLYKAYTSTGHGMTVDRFRQIEAEVQRAVRTWALYGSRSDHDPVRGAFSFTDSDHLYWPVDDKCYVENKSKWFEDTPKYLENRVNKAAVEYWRNKCFGEQALSQKGGIASDLYSITDDFVNGQKKQVWTFTYFSVPQPWPKP